MRRTLAGVIFGIGLLLAGIALGAWALQRAAVDPDRSADHWGVVISHEPLRLEIAAAIADATAARLNRPPDVLRDEVAANLLVDDGSDPLPTLTAGLLRDGHVHLIGESDAEVVVSGELMAHAVRSEAVGDLPGVTLSVPRLATLHSLDAVLAIMVPTSAIAAAVLLLLGVLTHPERAALIRPTGVGLIHIAVMVLLFGLLVPATLLPLLDGSPWADIPRLLSLQDVAWFVVLAVVCVGLAGALFAARASARRRRRWSRPIDTARYSEQHRWG